VAANEDLVHWVVQRQNRGRLAYEDAVQEGRIALWKALESYDPKRGRLSSYAVVAIRRAVWNAVRRDRWCSGDADEELGGEVPRQMSGAALDRVEEQVLLEQMVAGLPPRLRQVMVQHYGLDGAWEVTFRQIGWEQGVTRQRVQQLHVEALLWLADPVPSAALRRHVQRNGRRDLQAFLARRRAWQRRGRFGR
jgi:RNA polymerase sigma factor (sigma-70 family)